MRVSSERPSRRFDLATLKSGVPCKKTASFMGLKLWQIPSYTTELQSLISTEAVRKPSEFLQTIAQSEIFRDFVASKRSEGSKKRTK
jgi:hypothetical protein